MFCKYILHKRHSPVFFLNNVGDITIFNSVDIMSHIFGPKLDIVSDSYVLMWF